MESNALNPTTTIYYPHLLQARSCQSYATGALGVEQLA